MLWRQRFGEGRAGVFQPIHAVTAVAERHPIAGQSGDTAIHESARSCMGAIQKVQQPGFVITHQADLLETIRRAFDQAFDYAPRVMAPVHIIATVYNHALSGRMVGCVLLNADEHALKHARPAMQIIDGVNDLVVWHAPLLRRIHAATRTRVLNASVARTRAARMPGSIAEWPASSTTS